jgi:uncharacterized protein (TIGR03435 family)
MNIMRSVLITAAAMTFALPIAVGVAGDAGLQAQSQSPSFDAVSVKRNVTGGAGMQMRIGPAQVSASNVPVRQLIRQAYQLQEFQIVGGPDWVSSDRFDIEGRFDPTVQMPGFEGPARLQSMLKNLLLDRFKLVAHTENRELPIYALTLARTDGRLGPQMKPSAVDCAALTNARGRVAAPPDGARGGPPPDGRGRGGPAPADGRGTPPPPGTAVSLGERPQCGGRGGFGQLIAGAVTMAQLASQLSQLTSRVVIDRTGLTGGYDLDLKWTPAPDQLPQGPPPPGVEPPAIDPNGPSLFTALQEQLGLKLDAQRGPVTVLVVDRIEPPAEN